MHKKSTKERAVILRKSGYSYNLIAEKLSVSKSTLYSWLSEIPYQPNQEVIRRIGKARAQSGASKHRQKLASFAEARQLAKIDLGSVTERDSFMFGLALYAGEGEKNDTVGVINSDPAVIKFIVSWLSEFYGVKNQNLTLAIHLYPDNNTATSLKYWSKTTGVPLGQFGKTQIDKRPNKKNSKRGKLPYGTAHLRVKSLGNKNLGVLLSRRIQATIDLVLM